jgi:hypothetical protein
MNGLDITDWAYGGYLPGDGHCTVCGRHVQPGYLMCGPHWRLVPKHLAALVWNALDAWNGGFGTLDALRAAQAEATAVAGVGR